MKDNQHIICYGEVLWDMLPTGAKPGGAPLNVAIHLQKQGAKPILISKIGNDDDGNRLLKFLKEAQINTDYLQLDEQLPTSTVQVHLDEHKNASYEICEPVAWDNILLNSANKSIVQNAHTLVFGTLASRNSTSLNTLVELAKNTTATKLLDVNLRPPYDKREIVEQLIQLADFVKLNDEELETIAKWNNQFGDEAELIKWFAQHYKCQSVCITHGANGAALYTNNKLFEHSGFKVEVADTVGAGDSFFASLIVELSNNTCPNEALTTACATGAFVASQKGAVPTYTIGDIEKIKNRK